MTRKLTRENLNFIAQFGTFSISHYLADRGLPEDVLHRLLGDGKTRTEVATLEIELSHRIRLLLHPSIMPLKQTQSFVCDCAERALVRGNNEGKLSAQAYVVLDHARRFLDGKVNIETCWSIYWIFEDIMIKSEAVYSDSFAVMRAALSIFGGDIPRDIYRNAVFAVGDAVPNMDRSAERAWQFNRLQEYPGFPDDDEKGWRQDPLTGEELSKRYRADRDALTRSYGASPELLGIKPKPESETEKKPVHETNDTNETCYFCHQSTEILLGQSRYCPRCKK